MHPDATKLDAESAPLASSKVRLCTLEHLDGRTRAAKRAHELIAAFESDLGGKLSSVDRLAVRRASVLVALAENAAAKELAGETTDIDLLVRINNAARRAVADLNLPKRDKRATGPTLAEHLAMRARERAEASNVEGT